MNDLTANSGNAGEKKCNIAACAFSVTFRKTLCLDSVHKSKVSLYPLTTIHSIIKPFNEITAFNTRARVI